MELFLIKKYNATGRLESFLGVFDSKEKADEAKYKYIESDYEYGNVYSVSSLTINQMY